MGILFISLLNKEKFLFIVFFSTLDILLLTGWFKQNYHCFET